jgi:hypothetical protein
MTKLDQLLYWYTLTFSTALILSALGSGFTLENLTTLAFFLPVPAYLLLQITKRYYLWRQTTDHPPAGEAGQPLTTNHRPPTTFSLKTFITQANPAFIISLVLLVTAWLLSLLKSL